MALKKQVSLVIRISQGERDASARATHLEAATRKFLVTTNERKYMSTKTNFKRVALVAVTALGMGVLSSVPSQATIVGTPTVTATAGTATVAKSDSTTAATVAVRYYGDTAATDSATVTFTLGGVPTGAANPVLQVTFKDTATSTGVSTVNKGAGGALSGTSDSIVATTLPLIAGAANSFVAAKVGVHLSSQTTRLAGTYTINYLVQFYQAGTGTVLSSLSVAGTTTIVVTDGAVAATGAVSAAGQSKAVMKGGVTWATHGNSTDIDSVVVAVNTPSSVNPSAVIRVTQLTSDGLPSRESITVTTTVGNVGNSDDDTNLGKSVTLVGAASGVNEIGVYADGTSGTATITIKTTSVTFTAKTVTFYSETVDKFTVVPLATVIGGSAANALLVLAYDASNNQIVDNTSAYAYSSNLDVIATGGTAAAATGTACLYSAAAGGQVCSLTGSANGTADITIRNKSTAALSTVASTATKLTVNTLLPAKVSLAFDKATYAPGEAAYIIVRAVDAAGNPVAPNATSTNLLATGGISATLSFGNGSETTTATAVNLRTTTAAGDGYSSTTAIGMYKVYMPASGGTVKISATGGSALPAAGQVAVSATASVTDSGAAALAAVNALATTVASLRTLITTLTNLVLKIQKKVKA
jgi:hypothetical protein